MRELRLWIAVLALTSLATGVGAGVWIAQLRQPATRDESAPATRSADYQALFLATFDLSAERQRLFSELMRRYDEELAEKRQQALAQSVALVETDLARLGMRYRDLIRNHVLPSEQRARFDDLATGSALGADAR